MFENPELCKACGGKCCKTLPGCCYPADFGLPNLDAVVGALKSGKYAIDWWEDDGPLFFIRPAVKDCDTLYDPTWGGECIFLTETGCELAFKDRPMECRELMPSINVCRTSGEVCKHGAAKAWEPFMESITEVFPRD